MKIWLRVKDTRDDMYGQRYFFKVKEAEAIDENRAFSLD